jgi:hypothetical protein
MIQDHRGLTVALHHCDAGNRNEQAVDQAAVDERAYQDRDDAMEGACVAGVNGEDDVPAKQNQRQQAERDACPRQQFIVIGEGRYWQ